MSDNTEETLKEVLNLLRGLRLDVNHLAQAQGVPVLTEQNSLLAQRQKLVNRQAVAQALEKSKAHCFRNGGGVCQQLGHCAAIEPALPHQ